MAKQTKPKPNRTQIKDLNLAPQELTTEEANKVKGGNQTVDPTNPNVVYVGGSNRYSAGTQPTATSVSSPITKK